MTPRILGLLVAGRLHVDYGLVASRLVAAGWRAWPEPQRHAVQRFWCAWWRVALDDHPGAHRIVDALEIVSVSTGTLIPWLDTWSAIRTPAADRHLFDAVAWWLPEWALSDLWFGWDNELHATPDLMPWLLSLDEGRLDPAQRLEIQQLAEWLDAAANTP